MGRSRGEKIFGVFNAVFILALSAIAIYPFLYVVSASLSSPLAVSSGKVWFWPVDLELGAYKQVVNYPGIWMAYGNTIFYAVVGTLVSVVFTVFAAYALSKKRLRGAGILTMLIAFTMWFQPGMIPTYLNFRDLHLLDTRTALIFGFCVTPFYLFIMRTYFASIPESLEESAKLDGATDFQVLWNIYLPLSIPCIITIILYYLVDRWNSYFWAMTLLKDEKKIPLQVILNKLIVQANWAGETGNTDIIEYNVQTLVYSTIVVAILPMLCAYPALQKYFIKGLTVGAIKG